MVETRDIMSLRERLDFSKLRSFLTDRVIGIVMLGGVGGVLGAGFEILFSYVILLFLSVFEIVPAGSSSGMIFGIQFDKVTVLILLFGIGSLRASLNSMQQYLVYRGYLDFLEVQRLRLIRFALQSDSIDSVQAHSIFGEYSSHSATVVMAAQSIFIQAISFVCILVPLLTMAPKTTAILLLIILIVGFGLQLAFKLLPLQDRTMYSTWEELYKRFILALKNLLLIQIHGMRDTERKLTVDGLKKYHVVLDRTYRWTLVRGLLPQIVGVAGVCAVIPFLNQLDQVESAQVIAYLYLFFRASQNLGTIVQNTSSMRDYYGAFEKVFGWWQDSPASEADIDKVCDAATGNFTKKSGPLGWSLKNVSFTYPRAARAVLDSVSFEIKPGSVAVIMGESGRGKTTLLNLMLGVLNQNAGTIRLQNSHGELNLSPADQQILDSIGYVGPESFIFSGSILDNLLYGLKRKPTESEIKRVLQLADAEFVYNLKNGILHELTDQGQGLSAGQKQRISLARALLRDPLAIIIDEGTSNLDQGTEARVLRNLVSLKSEMTIVAVTHRDSYLEISDSVIRL